LQLLQLELAAGELERGAPREVAANAYHNARCLLRRSQTPHMWPP
jgi:hypothetical protein